MFSIRMTAHGASEVDDAFSTHPPPPIFVRKMGILPHPVSIYNISTLGKVMLARSVRLAYLTCSLVLSGKADRSASDLPLLYRM
jgi:hypothetical protein